MTENNENLEKADAELASASVDEQAQEQAEEAIEQHKKSHRKRAMVLTVIFAVIAALLVTAFVWPGWARKTATNSAAVATGQEEVVAVDPVALPSNATDLENLLFCSKLQVILLLNSQPSILRQRFSIFLARNLLLRFRCEHRVLALFMMLYLWHRPPTSIRLYLLFLKRSLFLLWSIRLKRFIHRQLMVFLGGLPRCVK